MSTLPLDVVAMPDVDVKLAEGCRMEELRSVVDTSGILLLVGAMRDDDVELPKGCEVEVLMSLEAVSGTSLAAE